jgi:prephenate dehydrogenase
MLRLAHSPEAVWEPIVRANAGSLAFELRALARLLDDAARGLEAGDVATLMSYFEHGRRAVAAMERSEFAGRSLPDTVSPR